MKKTLMKALTVIILFLVTSNVTYGAEKFAKFWRPDYVIENVEVYEEPRRERVYVYFDLNNVGRDYDLAPDEQVEIRIQFTYYVDNCDWSETVEFTAILRPPSDGFVRFGDDFWNIWFHWPLISDCYDLSIEIDPNFREAYRGERNNEYFLDGECCLLVPVFPNSSDPSDPDPGLHPYLDPPTRNLTKPTEPNAPTGIRLID